MQDSWPAAQNSDRASEAAQPPTAGPVIALFCTRGMEALLSNAIQGILRVGIDPGQILVGCPNNALGPVAGITNMHSARIRTISTPKLSKNETRMESYSSFGSTTFNDICWKKVLLIRDLIETHPHVIYADLDVSWIRNPLHYLSKVASIYPMAFQTEGLPRFPPALCCGFVSFARSERTVAFLDALIELHAGQVDSEERFSDQEACQQLLENDLTWLRDIYCLPEALFLNGLGYRNLQQTVELPRIMEGELSPFLFHANWTIGFDNKRKLMASTGTWLLGDIPPMGQTIVDSGTEVESDTAADVPPPALLTVVFPVFDPRGDIIERIRVWTQEQDFDPPRYRVFAVAGAETELDETALRKVLRNQDAFLRIPGAGRDNDYWNAGAREATTPWLLFVEAHSVPERDSLSSLAAWITANPNEVICNFRIKNLKGHMGDLMERWFGEVHSNWAATTTWRRLHRPAFAMRRDTFEETGPFVSRYGAFAPALLSARLHQLGYSISLIPTSHVNHEDAPDMPTLHADTENYVRGEMDARAENDPALFEKYFGPPPSQGRDTLPAKHARSMVRGLVVAALHRPRQAFDLVSRACALLPAASVSLRERAQLLAASIRIDQLSATYLSLPKELRWRRFVVANDRVVRAEQIRWAARNPVPALKIGPENGRWSIENIGLRAISGVHALEHLDAAAFRWTDAVFLLRLAAVPEGVLTFETRNLRPGIGLSDITVVVGGKLLSSANLEFDDTGNIKLRLQPSPEGKTDIVVISPELREPADENGPGRRLGLPLFSVGFECGQRRDLRQ